MKRITVRPAMKYNLAVLADLRTSDDLKALVLMLKHNARCR